MAARVVIVGGGISGLTTAWRLLRNFSKADLELRVLESSARLGGTTWTEQAGGYLLETGPNGFLDNKPTTLELCRELGLESQLVRADSAASNRYVFLGDRLRKLPASPGEFVKSDLLSWRGRLRVLLERFIPKRTSNDDESIDAFGCRRIGKEATEVLLDAFVTGILAGDPKLLSLPACFPRMRELEQQYGGLLRAQFQLAKERRRKAREHPATGATAKTKGNVGGPGGTLTSLAGGMRTIIDALSEKLAEEIERSAPAASLQRDSASHRWSVIGTDGRSWSADAVVLSCPAYAQAEMLAALDQELAREVGGIAYTTAVVAVLGFRRSDLSADLNGFGYLTPQRLGRPVLGVLYSSSIYPGQSPDGEFQFRAILGGWTRRDVIEWDDEAIYAAVQSDLEAALRIRAVPCFRWICRWPKAIPQYHLGHLDRLARIDRLVSKHDGLFLGGNAYRGVSLNDCTREANAIAESVAHFLERRDLSNHPK